MAACKSCGARIIWCTTAKTGSAIPVDADPVAEGAGNITLSGTGGNMIATIGAKGSGTHVSHFATCAYAGQHKRKR